MRAGVIFCQENDRDLAVRRNPVSDCADGVANRPGGVPARPGGEFLYMRSRSCLLEADQLAHALQLGDEAIAAACVVEPADEPVGAKVGVGGVVVQQMPGDHQDRVPDRQGGLFLADTPGEPPELRSQVAITLAGSRPGTFHERFPQPPVASAGGAGLAFPSGDVVARTHPCPRRTPGTNCSPTASAALSVTAGM